MRDHRLTKDQHDRLVAKRRAIRESMRCRGVKVEVIARDAIGDHPQALTFQRAIDQYGYGRECAGGCDDGDTLSPPFVAFMRRRPKWDEDTFWLALCAGCAGRPDLRAVITRATRDYFLRNDLTDHFVTSLILPAELDGVS